jgi:hypothetical protein
VGGGGVDWVDLCLDGGIGWFILVALSGSFSGLTHGGCQMLRSSNRRLSGPEHKWGKCEGIGQLCTEAMEMKASRALRDCNECLIFLPRKSLRGLFIGMVRGADNNI